MGSGATVTGEAAGDGAELGDGDAGVGLGGLEVGVAEHLSDVADVPAAELRCVMTAMPWGVSAIACRFCATPARTRVSDRTATSRPIHQPCVEGVNLGRRLARSVTSTSRELLAATAG